MSTEKKSVFRTGGLGETDLTVEQAFTHDRFEDFLTQIEVEFADLAEPIYDSGLKTERSNERLAHILGIMIFYEMNPLGGRTYLCKERFGGRSPDLIHLIDDTELGQEAAIEIVATNKPSIQKIRDLNAAGLPVFVLFWDGDPKKAHFERKVENELSINHSVQTGTISLQYCGWTNPGDPIGYNQKRDIVTTEKWNAREIFHQNFLPAYIEASARVARLPANAACFQRVSGIEVWEERHPIIHIDWSGKSSNYDILSCKYNGWCSLDPAKIITAIQEGECKEIFPPYGIRSVDESQNKCREGRNSVAIHKLSDEDKLLIDKARIRMEKLPDNHRDLIS